MPQISRKFLSELCDVTSSKRIYAEELSRSGVPFYRTKDIVELLRGREALSDPLFIPEERFQEILKQTGAPVSGDVLLTSRGTLGVPYIVKASDRFHFADGNLTWFRKFCGLDSRYLYYFFLSPGGKAELARCVIGAAQAAYTLVSLKEIELGVPPLSIQRRIASILSTYDDLIENNRKRIAILEDMARRLYREWFVHFRYPGHESVQLADSPLGQIPQGWEVRRFGEVIALNYGKALKAEERRPGSVPVYGSSGVVGYHSESMESGPGLIVGRKGNVGSLHWSDVPFYPIDTVYFASSAIFPLRYLLHSMACMNFLNNDAAVPGLSRQQAYGLDVVVPPQEPLREFCEFADSWGQLASNLMRQNGTLRRTRDLLLPRLMSGTLSVEALATAEAAVP